MAAHAGGVVHRDVKPANILVGKDDTVKIVDFGLASMEQQIGTRLTKSGLLIGTPEYMSPEQAQGLAGIDHRSDVYSLGALGYRMLVGRPPFRGNRVTQTLAKQVTEAATPIREINPTVPKDFADAIMRCLAKDPADRFPTAMHLRSALEAVTFFSGRTEEAGPEKFSTTQRTLVTLLVGLTLLLGLVIGMALR